MAPNKFDNMELSSSNILKHGATPPAVISKPRLSPGGMDTSNHRKNAGLLAPVTELSESPDPDDDSFEAKEKDHRDGFFKPNAEHNVRALGVDESYVASDLDSESELSGTADISLSPENSATEAELLALRETQQLCWLRGIVLVALLLATFLVSVVIFYSTRRNESDQFDAQFTDHAQKIIDAFRWNVLHGVEAVDNFAVSITSYSDSINLQWPFVTIPQFEVRAASARALGGISSIALLPTIQSFRRSGWESYAPAFNQWVEDGLDYQSQDTTFVDVNARRDLQDGDPQATLNPEGPDPIEFKNGIPASIYRFESGIAVVEDVDNAPYYPIWQHSPVNREQVNFNLGSSTYREEILLSLESSQVLIGKVAHIPDRNSPFQVLPDIGTVFDEFDEPVSKMYLPVFDALQLPRTIVAVMTANIRWADFLRSGTLPQTDGGIFCVISNGCDQAYTFKLNGQSVIYLGEGDLHDEYFDYSEVSVELSSLFLYDSEPTLTFNGIGFNMDYCPYTLSVYPTSGLQLSFFTRQPAIYTSLVVIVFLFTSLVFLTYDYLVERRQKLVMKTAVKSHEIVSNLFPAVVRDRLFGGEEDPKNSGASLGPVATQKLRLKTYLGEGGSKEGDSSQPIADLFPSATVFFADIAGFTAWSSVREPAQVFTLLETVYAALDKIATRRKVFKVETIGDCYMAVTGLPDPQPDHAIIMARFAREVLAKMEQLTAHLEVELGPDTADLNLRVGLHSGPVTAGVLRGQKSRFQLFGDTVNTASRMESTGKSRQIQCSTATAELIKIGGKPQWLQPRQELVEAKGKGKVKTYWILAKLPSTADSISGMSLSENDAEDDEEGSIYLDVPANMNANKDPKNPAADLSPQIQRLIGWNVDLLSRLLKRIIAGRSSQAKHKMGVLRRQSAVIQQLTIDPTEVDFDKNPIDEYCEAISLAKFDLESTKNKVDPDFILLDPAVETQLREYVTTIACSYNENPFHNFEHASHVAMTANKIMKRVVSADGYEAEHDSLDIIASEMHSYTYGITSDPMIHFTVVLSAMIHDVDHPGVSNQQLIKEDDNLAALYNNKSVAEQNSIDLAWELLMDPTYDELRKCIYIDDVEYKRFRSLLVNSVMATDIFDPDLKKLREKRWEKAFPDTESQSLDGALKDDDLADLKATIVIEHLIQASDVAHTMQHWHVYQKWNKRLFEELYTAHLQGRTPTNPSVGWYMGELWFYDNYIIPLAKKLKECGVFGVASDEFLTYAMENRNEWESTGEEIVQEMMSECMAKHKDML